MTDQQDQDFDDQSDALVMPSTGWVVHQVLSSKQQAPELWAWCQVNVAEPGYQEITFTNADGQTKASPPSGYGWRLGPVIVKVWC